MKRIAAILVLCSIAPASGAAAEKLPGPVSVVYDSSVEAYVQAVKGLTESLGVDYRVLDLRKEGEKFLPGAEGCPERRILVAVGAEALEVLRKPRPGCVVVATMVLHADAEAAGIENVVGVDIQPTALAKKLHAAFPKNQRLGLIWNPAVPGPGKAETLAAMHGAGYGVRVAEAASPAALVSALASLRGRTDFAVCLPDATLYNSATVKRLIMASLEYRIPIVAYSSAFLKAGAAVAVFPDFDDIGRQTGEALRLYLSGGAARIDRWPRRLRLGVNPAVLRLLGMEQPQAEGMEVSR